MNLSGIKRGAIAKNYKHMCELLEEDIKGGESKRSQLREWGRYFKFHKEGNKLIIDNIYDIPIEKTDGRSDGNNKSKKNINGFNIPWEDRNRYGIYIIKYRKNIYVGSTITTFRGRFMQHKNNYDGKMNHTQKILEKGGTFQILLDMSDVIDVDLIRMIEDYFIKYFITHKYYKCINVINGSWKNKSHKIKNIKIKEENYLSAIQLLIQNGLIEVDSDDI